MTVYFRKARGFLLAESGGVTVDFILLTAMAVALTIAVISSIGGGTRALGDSTVARMSESAPS